MGLTGLVVFPWFLEPGFLFLLDFVWPPQLPVPGAAWQAGHVSSLPWQWLWWALATFFPTDVVQKIAYALPLLLAGISMYQLVAGQLHPKNKHGTLIPAVVAGMMYAFNPFVVTRLVMGQHYLLLAYALTPWAILTWSRYTQHPSWRRGLVAGLVITGIMLTNAHHLLLLPLLLVCLLPWPRRGSAFWSRPLLGLLTPIIIFLVITVGLQQTTPSPISAFSSEGPWARSLRAPASGNLLLDTLTLTATWKTDLLFLLPYELVPGFHLLAVLLLLIQGYGIMCVWHHPNHGYLVRRLLVVALGSIVLAIGVAHPVTAPLAAWLYHHVPLWIGLRDSAKFLALLALAQSMFLGFGVTALLATIRARTTRRMATVGALAIVTGMFFIISPVFRGVSGQIFPQRYPDSWHEWQTHVATQPRSPRTLFLPWHMYLPFEFTAGRTVVNPAPGFFTTTEIISGDNSEVGGSFGRPFIATESTRPMSRQIEQILAAAPVRRDIGQRLATENIYYVMLATEAVDAAQYRYLHQQPDLRLVFEKPDLVVWENIALVP